MLQIAPKGAGLKLLDHFPTGNMVWLEKYLHQAFAHRRVKLEWFRLTEEDVKLIRSITAADGVDDLPSAIAAQHTLNEANGFVWGERDDAAETPQRVLNRVMIGLPMPLVDAIERYAAAQYSTATRFVTEAVVAYMKKNGVPIPQQN